MLDHNLGRLGYKFDKAIFKITFYCFNLKNSIYEILYLKSNLNEISFFKLIKLSPNFAGPYILI
jgi:hypothetical protein